MCLLRRDIESAPQDIDRSEEDMGQWCLARQHGIGSSIDVFMYVSSNVIMSSYNLSVVAD